MDILLAKIFATALVFSQVATTPSQVSVKFDEIRDQAAVTKLLQAGCAHMRKAFDVEDINLDDLIATAMADVDALSSERIMLRGINVKHLLVGYRQFCKNERVFASPINLGEIIRFYNKTLAELPSSLDLTKLKPPGATTVFDSTGERYHQRRVWAPIEQIPLLVQQAFIAAEDKRFYDHNGIDERALVRAFIANIARSGRLQGGSTITQQVVKNLVVGGKVAYERKMREMVLASRLEKAVDKSTILELYLNSIYLGRGAWGVEMAAESYFGKSLDKLDVAEAALLASLAKGPAYFNPERHPTRSRERTAYVLGRLHDDGYIDSASFKAASAKLPPNLVAYEGSPRGSHFIDQLAREAKSVMKKDLFGREAYMVRATIHPELQRAAEAALQEGLSRYERNAGRVEFQGSEINLAEAVAQITSEPSDDESKPAWQTALDGARLPLHDLHWSAAIVINEPSGRSRGVRVGLASGQVLSLSLGRVPRSKLKRYDVVRVKLTERKGKAVRAELRVPPVVQGAVVVLENQTGRILAMAGGFSYSLSQLNRTTQSQRQPGSSLKPLVYLAALQSGLQPNTLIRDDAVTYPPIGGSTRSEDFWTPKNFDGGEGGVLTIRQALEKSRNLATARLLGGIAASPPQSLDYVCKLAQHLKLYTDCIQYYPFVLGAQPVRPIDLAAFYATIANEGFRPTPYTIETISRDDETIYRHEPALEEVTSADRTSFYQLKAMLQGVLARGTARRIADMAPYVAGKTGTTDNENDAWFVGFSNEVTVAVWVGYDNADGHRRTLGAGGTGGNVAIPIFEPVMKAVWAHYAPKTALRPASPEAKSHLVVKREQKSRKAAMLPEYFRRDEKGRAVNSRFRLVSRKDRDAFAAAHAPARKPRKEATQPQRPHREVTRRPQREPQRPRIASDGRNNPWFDGRGWGGWRWPGEENRNRWPGEDNRWRGGGGFW